MTEAQEKEIYKKFGWIYRHRKRPAQVTCMCWGLSVGEGWYSIIYLLSATLTDYIKKTYPWHVRLWWKIKEELSHPYNYLMEKMPHIFQIKRIAFPGTEREKIYYTPRQWFPYGGPHVEQVKEKFGTLRYYTSGFSDEIESFISKMENETYYTCEGCGNYSTVKNDGGWLSNQCDFCELASKKEEL